MRWHDQGQSRERDILGSPWHDEHANKTDFVIVKTARGITERRQTGAEDQTSTSTIRKKEPLNLYSLNSRD